MREQDREHRPEPERQRMRQCSACLDVLIHQHGDEHISTLAQLISLTTRVENSLTHRPRYR